MMASRPKILVVENDPAALERLETTLSLVGAETRSAADDAEAARLIERDRFDGAFVDWDNSPLGAQKLLRRIRRSKSNPRIPIVMLTACYDARAVAEGFRVGATFFLVKPFEREQLERLLNVSRGTMLEERRRYHRVPLRVRTLCVWGSKGRQKRVWGSSLNISNSGLLMRISPQPAVGAEVWPQFVLPDSRERLALRGVVVRSERGDRMAIRFIGLSDGQRETLESFVSNQPVSALFPAG